MLDHTGSSQTSLDDILTNYEFGSSKVWILVFLVQLESEDNIERKSKFHKLYYLMGSHFLSQSLPISLKYTKCTNNHALEDPLMTNYDVFKWKKYNKLNSHNTKYSLGVLLHKNVQTHRHEERKCRRQNAVWRNF